jgi:hypothetical protein
MLLPLSIIAAGGAHAGSARQPLTPAFRMFQQLQAKGRIADPKRLVVTTPGGLVATPIPAPYDASTHATMLTHASADPRHVTSIIEFYVQFPAANHQPTRIYGPFEAIDGGLHALPVQLDDGQVRVASDVTLETDAAKHYARRLEAAFARDVGELKWKSQPDLRSRPLTFQLLSDDAATQFYPGNAGAAIGPDVVMIPMHSMDDAGGDGILVHELSHVQSGREGSALPHWLEEGKAGLLQLDYLQGQNYAMRLPKNYLSTVTSKVARQYLDGYGFGPVDRSKTWWSDATGAFLTEFIRTRLRRSGPYADAGKGDFADGMTRIARIAERAAQQHAQFTAKNPRATWDPGHAQAAFEAAYAEVFGITFAATEQQFAQFLDDTQAATTSDPTVRFRGTIYDPGRWPVD